MTYTLRIALPLLLVAACAVVPPARRVQLEELTNAQLEAEASDIAQWIDHHAAAEGFNFAARLAADALRDSLCFVRQIQKERLYP
jgi:hypothetical protein